jgi:hypothetical protein
MLKPSAQERLRKLLRLLSSDRPAEIVAAASAIMRTLATEGLDIHSLADALCRLEPPAETKAQRTAHEDRADDTDWYSIACKCNEHEDRLSEREQKFVSDMVTWTRWRPPSEKQQSWLLAIFSRVRRYG